MTGSERGGLLVGYTFNRADTDAGRDFATRNSFPAFRRNLIDLHTFALKYLPAPYIAWTMQWNYYNIETMRGTGTTARGVRKALGLRGRELGETGGGGDYQAITFDVNFRF
jgi:hypothetical protein